MLSENEEEVARIDTKAAPSRKKRVFRERVRRGEVSPVLEVVGAHKLCLFYRCSVQESHEAFGVNATMPSIVTPMARSSKGHERCSASRNSSDPCPTPLAVSKKNLSPLLA